MEILHSEVIPVRPGVTPDYNQNNPLARLLRLVESTHLAAGRECYTFEELQFLFPIRSLQLYGPSAPNSDVLNPEFQDVKTDFQKQNVATFALDDTQIIRGQASAGAWVGPFIRLTYRGGPDSVLATAAGKVPGPAVKLWTRIGTASTPFPITVPYNEGTDRYSIELWGWPGSLADLRAALDPRGQLALDRGELVAAPQLVQGGGNEFTREALEGKFTNQVAPQHALHPTLPLHIEVAWGTVDEQFWDSMNGANHQYEFNMALRGWERYLGVGVSSNPHGGIGFLEFRNLLSNYFHYESTHELAREIPPWSFDAFGNKSPDVTRRENFMAVDYMDLHIVRPNAGIGLHRHRDNQEVFLLMSGDPCLMVIGDWCRLQSRERCFEIRILKPGHLALLKGGNLHGLMNPSDEDLALFMFGGYD